MTADPEALAQLARLLADDRARTALAAEAQALVDAHFSQLVDGLLAEALASDDVIDADSAIDFLTARLDFFGSLVSEVQRSRLLEALRATILKW